MVRAQTIAATTTAQQDEQREPSNDTAVAQATKGKKGAVAAGDVQKRLDAAAKSLEAGKAEQAVQQINAVLAGAKLESTVMARALYLRGAAWRKQGKPAQAIADLTSALWLKGGLSDSDRAAATAMRAEAYREAGLADQPAPTAKGGRQVAAASPSASAWETDTTASSSKSTSGSGTSTKQAPAAPSAGTSKNSGGNFFSNLFSGNTSTTAPPSSTNTASAPPKEQGTRQASIGESWSNTTDVKPASGGAAGRTEPPQAAVKTAPVKAAPETRGGRYRLQVAAVRSRGEAQTLAGKLKKEHPAELASRQLDIDETVIGNMGTFYRVRIGPYADATEPRALCAKLRGSGLDCLIIGD
jgi:hypothetical protein